MSQVSIQTAQSAPAGAQPVLRGAERAFGFVPNLLGVLANSPAAVKAYTQLGALLDASSLTPTEVQVALIEVSVENDCEYCVAAHTAISAMKALPQDVIDAVRTRRPIEDPKLEALRLFTRAVVSHRGRVQDSEKEAFFAAGYGAEQMFDVVTAVAMKVLSNYTNHLAVTPLDEAFQQATWSAADAA